MRRAQRRSSLVLLGEGGDGDGDAGEVEALVVGDHAAFDDGGVDAGAVDVGDLEADFAVVDEDAFAAGDVGGEAVVRGAAGSSVAFGAVFDGDGEVSPRSRSTGPSVKWPRRIFGP